MSFIPALQFPKHICSAWAAVFFLLFHSASSVCAELPNHAQSPNYGKPLTVTIVQSEDGGPYAEFSQALHKILSDDGITHVVIDATKPIPDSGLVIGVGMKAAAAVAASDATSVLNVFIPKSGHEKLLRDFPHRSGSNTYATIYLDQPIPRQANLVASILPGKHNVGLLYSSPPEELAQLRQELTRHGLILHTQAVDPAFPLAEALQAILRSSDVLLALPDAVVYNSSTIRNLLLATYRNGVPLIGFSSGYVMAGGLCAVFSTPAQIATQAAALARQFGDAHVLPTVQYPHEFIVLVNEQVARSLGLQIKGAAVLHDEISAEDRRKP